MPTNALSSFWESSGNEATANSEQDADAQASAAQSAAQSACESQVNGEIEAALSAVHGYFDNLKFSYNEINIPHGFDSTLSGNVMSALPPLAGYSTCILMGTMA